MRFKPQISILALALPLAACGGGNGTPASTQEPAPIARSGISLADAGAPLVTPPAPAAPAPVVVEKLPTEKQPEAALPPPKSYAEAMQRAQDLGDKGDHADAIDALKIAAKLAPKSAVPHVELARLYLADGKLTSARKHAAKATVLNPAWSAAWNMLGRVEMADGKLEEARAAFQTSIESNDDNAYAWNNLGLTFIYAEKWQDAADALEHAVATPSAKPYMWNNLGVAYEHLDRLDEARHAYEQAANGGSDAGKQSRSRLDGVKSIVKTTATATPPTVAPSPVPEVPSPAGVPSGSGAIEQPTTGGGTD